MEAIRDYKGLFIAAAGNEGINTDITPQYPAGYGDQTRFPDVQNVLTVGSLNDVTNPEADAERSFFSNYGNNSVHIYAPGRDILSIFPKEQCTNTTTRLEYHLDCEVEWNKNKKSWEDNGTKHYEEGYHWMIGTSFAAPYVAGVAALLLSINPDLSAEQLKAAIISGADIVSAYMPTSTGGMTRQNIRRLNAYEALNSLNFLTTSISNGNVTITGLTNSGRNHTGTIAIPAKINENTVTTIASNAFSNAKCSEVIIPNSLININQNAFVSNPNLKSFTVDPTNKNFSSNNGILYNKNKTTLIRFPQGITGELTIDSTVNKIEGYAFYLCSKITKVYIPIKIATIGENAFSNCTALTIYPEINSKPNGWAVTWNGNCPIVWGKPHNHSFSYLWRNTTKHYKNCDCGYSELLGHVISGSESNIFGKNSSLDSMSAQPLCLLCGGVVDLGFIQLGIILPNKLMKTEQILAPDKQHYPVESFYIGDILICNYEDTTYYLSLQSLAYNSINNYQSEIMI